MAAVKRYNNVELDGKPMKIEIVGTNVASAGALPPAGNGIVRNPLGPRRYNSLQLHNVSLAIMHLIEHVCMMSYTNFFVLKFCHFLVFIWIIYVTSLG